MWNRRRSRLATAISNSDESPNVDARRGCLTNANIGLKGLADDDHGLSAKD